MNATPKKRWLRFTLRTMLLVTLASMLLISIVKVVRIRESWRTQTICVRLTSSGTVNWGKDIGIADFEPYLAKDVRLFVSHGFKPRLLIQSYSDAHESDITELKAIGYSAGCDIVDIEQLSFPSPDLNQRPDDSKKR